MQRHEFIIDIIIIIIIIINNIIYISKAQELLKYSNTLNKILHKILKLESDKILKRLKISKCSNY